MSLWKLYVLVGLDDSWALRCFEESNSGYPLAFAIGFLAN